MKRLLLWSIIGILLSSESGVAQAQASTATDLTGQWQGTTEGLQPQQTRRVVFLVSRTEGATWRAVFNYIDLIAQGNGIPRPANLTLRGASVQIDVPGNGGSFQGHLSADGNTILGTWTQGGRSMRLDLAKASTGTAWEIPKPPPPIPPMAADADPSFEVATIKPSAPDLPGKGFRIRGRNFSTIDTSLADLVEFAYDVHVRQIIGGPDWIKNDKFDISAMPDSQGNPSNQQWKSMVQKLLADRFQLKLHHENRELSVYVLSLAKEGPKGLVESDRTDNQFSIPIDSTPGGFTIRVRNGNMGDFSGFGLQGAVLDRPVLDQTGLRGRYDFQLTWAPLGTEFGGHFAAPAPSENPPPDLFTAIREQLGMRLEAVKAPADVIVIDNVQHPSAN